MTMTVYEELFKSIKKKDSENVKFILSSSPYVNANKTDHRGQGMTLLHHASTGDICRELVLHGASVNVEDIDGRTPLHHAILYRSGFEVVRELLRCGACVNVRDKYNATPLIIAVQLLGKDVVPIVRELLKHGANPNIHDIHGCSVLTLAVLKNDLRLVQEMLEWDADINFRNESSNNSYMFISPLTEAVYRDEECAKLLIKMTVMKHFDNNYKQIINLNNFSKISSFIKLSSFLEECACEILQMKSHIININYRLFEFVDTSRKCFKPLYLNDKTIREVTSFYPIYRDIITTNIQPHLLRAQLLRELRCLQFYTAKDIDEKTTDNDSVREAVCLNADCSCKVLEYLTNDELSVLIKAFLCT